ncbi:cytochrome P450 [Rhizophagus diaphanus]|nr:cytochrome P450 [Rhizophagus diaphanus] [Rhizophagus sp. MUCL 43196]
MASSHQFGCLKCLKSPEIPHMINVYKYIISFIGTLLRMIFPFINKLPLESNKKFFTAIEEFDNFIYEIIENKKDEMKNNKINNKENSTDLLTKMFEYDEQEGINTDKKQLRDEMEMQERVRSEVINILGDKLTIPISEQLKVRIHPPTTLTNFRKPSNQIKVGSYVIPKDVEYIANSS